MRNDTTATALNSVCARFAADTAAAAAAVAVATAYDTVASVVVVLAGR